MIVPDVNLLVALFRTDHPHHDRARRWWDEAMRAGETFAVPDPVWVGFVRIVTNPRAVVVPSTLAEAVGAIGALVDDERHRPVVVGSTIRSTFEQLAAQVRARGNLVTDAYIAAVAVSLGASVVTFDRDFRKFDGVRVFEPA